MPCRSCRTISTTATTKLSKQHPKARNSQAVCLTLPACTLQILSHEINHGYKLGMLPLETFNSTPVQNLAHLAHLVDSSDDPYLNFGLDGGRFITLDRQQVRGLSQI